MALGKYLEKLREYKEFALLGLGGVAGEAILAPSLYNALDYNYKHCIGLTIQVFNCERVPGAFENAANALISSILSTGIGAITTGAIMISYLAYKTNKIYRENTLEDKLQEKKIETPTDSNV